MAREVLIQPRLGAKSIIRLLGASEDKQLAGELFASNNGNAESLYVGTGGTAANGKYVKTIVPDIALLPDKTYDGADYIVIHPAAGNDSHRITLGAILDEVTATSGDTKKVKVASSTTEGYLSEVLLGTTNQIAATQTGNTIVLSMSANYKPTNAGNADTVGGKSVGTSVNNIWTGETVMEAIDGTSISACFARIRPGAISTVKAYTTTQFNTKFGFDAVVGYKMLSGYSFTDQEASGSRQNVALHRITDITGTAITWQTETIANGVNARFGIEMTFTDDALTTVITEDSICYVDKSLFTGDASNYWSYLGTITIAPYAQGDGITIQDGIVSVHPRDTQSAIEVDNGVAINLAHYGLKDDDGLYIYIDASGGIQTNTVNPGKGSLSNGLAIKLATSSGLTLSSDGLKVNSISGGTI